LLVFVDGSLPKPARAGGLLVFLDARISEPKQTASLLYHGQSAFPTLLMSDAKKTA
jgi:hypothetical protein